MYSFNPELRLNLPDHHASAPGDCLTGVVTKLPRPATYQGTRLWMILDAGRRVSILANARRGRMVLDQLLERHKVEVGDAIEIVYHGPTPTRDGQRWFNDFSLRVLERAGVQDEHDGWGRS